MSDQNQSKRLVVHLPRSLFSKVEEAASRDYTSVSDICRKALASDLRVRGLLGETEGEVIVIGMGCRPIKRRSMHMLLLGWN